MALETQTPIITPEVDLSTAEKVLPLVLGQIASNSYEKQSENNGNYAAAAAGLSPENKEHVDSVIAEQRMNPDMTTLQKIDRASQLGAGIANRPS